MSSKSTKGYLDSFNKSIDNLIDYCDESRIKLENLSKKMLNYDDKLLVNNIIDSNGQIVVLYNNLIKELEKCKEDINNKTNSYIVELVNEEKRNK